MEYSEPEIDGTSFGGTDGLAVARRQGLRRSIPRGSENVRGRNGAEDGSDGHVSRVHIDTVNSVILLKRERSREARSYADVARENIGRPLDQ